MTNINGRQQQQQQSYWCHLCSERISFISSSSLLCPHCHSHLLEEIESPTLNTYANLFSDTEEAEEEEEVEVEEEDNRRQYTCFQCNVTTSLISSSSSPLLLCPHCHAEFWEELESLSPSFSPSNDPNLNSTLNIDDVPQEDEDRYGNSSTMVVADTKKNMERGWPRVIFHKFLRMFGFAI